VVVILGQCVRAAARRTSSGGDSGQCVRVATRRTSRGDNSGTARQSCR